MEAGCGNLAIDTPAMSKKISDSKLREYIGQIDKETLTGWLVEQCQNDNKLRSSLLDLAAPKEAAAALVSEIRSRITNAWAKTRSRDGYRQATYIGKELDSVLQSIGSIIEKGCYLEAEKVLVRYIEAAEKFGMEIDDSYGYLWPVCQAGVTLWGKVWAKIEPRNRIMLAELVYSHVHNNINGLKDDIITGSSDALAEVAGAEEEHVDAFHLRDEVWDIGDREQVPVAREGCKNCQMVEKMGKII